MLLSYEYDTTYPGPALPVVEITVRSLVKDNDAIQLPALVDSGADATMIPLQTLQHLKARQVDERRMRGVSGISYLVPIYEVTLQLGPYVIAKVYAIADKNNQDVILGRDVLNQFIVTLNGLAHIVEVSQ